MYNVMYINRIYIQNITEYIYIYIYIYVFIYLNVSGFP